MKSKVKAIVRTLLLVIVALVIGVAVYQMNAIRLGGNAVPMPFGVGAAVVLTGSMEPTLSAGDLLIIAERESYEVGDVVVFQSGRLPVVHRIIQKDGSSIVTMGDANTGADDPMDISCVKGEVVFALPLIGFVISFIRTPIGILLVLAFAVFLMERSFSKDKREKQDQLRQIREEIEKLKKQQENK
ncbi:MAG: signal peptidase I [Clostridia bacterium]|nr:signal peptidase I [Clostridia bacterium]